jgi:hypothetical protein
MAIVLLEGLGKLKKNAITSSGLESVILRLVTLFEYKKHSKVKIFEDKEEKAT